MVLDQDGAPVSTRCRVRTPYPCPPERFAGALAQIHETIGMSVDRVSVGMPGLIRSGVVVWTPHYVTESGPFSPVRADLALAWEHLDVQAMLTDTLGRPTIVVNDAEMAGLAMITGQGYEVMLTLGTGLGFAHYADGVLLPKIEVSAAPFRKGRTFDQMLGHHARSAHGAKAWSKDVQRALRRLFAVFYWDRAYLGGGGAKHLRRPVDDWVTLTTNHAGMLGGVRLWDDGPTSPRALARLHGQHERPGVSEGPRRPANDGSPTTG
jgi:polyphosphate glucokinase